MDILWWKITVLLNHCYNKIIINYFDKLSSVKMQSQFLNFCGHVSKNRTTLDKLVTKNPNTVTISHFIKFIVISLLFNLV